MYKHWLSAVCVALLFSSAAYAADIAGAGSSAAFPVYSGWAKEYARERGVLVGYDPVGSSAGLKKIKARETDFGASDVAPGQVELARHGLIVIPTVITGIAPIYNLPAIKGRHLVLNGDVLAKIFLGTINRWDARELRELNPGLPLPSQAILPVVRSDGSGTTYNFSDYLAKISLEWNAAMGVGTHLKWPANFAAEKGSKGVSEKVAATPGSIGYVDYNYVLDYHLEHAQMRNAEDVVVSANPDSFRAALKVSVWQSKGDFSQTLTNQAGKESWPITMGTFVLVPRRADKPEQALRTLRFFTWAFMRGDELANKLNFVRLPDRVQAKAFRALTEVVDLNGQPIGFKSLQMQGASEQERKRS